MTTGESGRVGFSTFAHRGSTPRLPLLEPELTRCVECGLPEPEWLGPSLWDGRLCSHCALDLGKLTDATDD